MLNNSKYKPLLKMTHYIKEFNKEFILCVIYGILNSVFALSAVLLGAYITSLALIGNTLKPLLVMLIPLLISIVGKGLFSFLEMYQSHLLAYRVIEKIRNLLYDAISLTAPQSIMKRRTGNITSALMEDVEATEVFYAHTVGSYIVSITCTVLYLIALFFFSVKIGVVILLACILVAVIPYLFHPITKKVGDELRDGLANVNAEAVDTVQGLTEILTFGKEKKYIEKVTTDTLKLNKIAKKDGHFKGLQNGLINLITSAVLIITILLTHSEVIAGTIKPEIISVIILFSLFAFIPIMSISITASSMNISNAAAKRILTILEENPTIVDTVDYNPKLPLTFNDCIEFKNVSFSYNKGIEVLKNVNFKIKAGTTVSIVGESGAGKSTIANLLMRFYDPNSGGIYVDDKNITEINQKALRDLIAYVPQDVYLFNKTIKENIALAVPNATDEEIKEAARIAVANEFIEKLPNGYNTSIGERGVQLSGGEKQRISIARAVLKKSPVILMDEAVSSLDGENEELFLKALNNIRKEKTIITIAHRASTIKNSEYIIKLENGKIK